ncbi:MAG: hypothetical protein J4F49_06810 [Rhodobacteraceae bacterium]|nr:hypothetical protein [Paracoccaceae bacterium]
MLHSADGFTIPSQWPVISPKRSAEAIISGAVHLQGIEVAEGEIGVRVLWRIETFADIP